MVPLDRQPLGLVAQEAHCPNHASSGSPMFPSLPFCVKLYLLSLQLVLPSLDEIYSKHYLVVKGAPGPLMGGVNFILHF